MPANMGDPGEAPGLQGISPKSRVSNLESQVYSRLKTQDCPTDAAFLQQFESCSWPIENWDHRAHVKVAYLYLTDHPFHIAMEKIRAGVKAYNAANNIPEGPDVGYHETITQAWIRIVHAAIGESDSFAGADAFCDAHTHLLDTKLLLQFYSRSHIMSPNAKADFVEPDVKPLPRAGAGFGIQDSGFRERKKGALPLNPES